MIAKYDPMEHAVRLYEAKLKGKLKQHVELENLTMSLIIEKNKKIDRENKLRQIRVVRARQLRIKISQIFNQKILKSTSLSQPLKKRYLLATSRLSLAPQIASSPITLTHKRASSHPILQHYLKHKEQAHPERKITDESGGMINLFDKFSQQEINQIESDQEYYLISLELVELFRKYMFKKRINNKDHSYGRFMLRNSAQKYEDIGQKAKLMSPYQLKRYILQRVDSMPNHQPSSQSHLLTNPLSIEVPSTRDDRKNKSQHHRTSLFLQLKRRQLQNEEKLKMQQEKKRRKLKIDIVYNAGIAAEVRAVQLDKRKLMLSQRSVLQNRRSIDCKNKLATIKDNYGKSVQLAEQIRMQFIKKRKNSQREAGL